MEYRKLGHSGTLVSNLALGTMNFGTKETPEADAFAHLDAFLDAGGNLIDTADSYNGGVAEETVGRWFAARPRDVTDHVVIATKGRSRTGDDVNDAGTSRRHLDWALTTSLRRRFETDTIDLYQMHAWDPLTPVEEALSFLDSAVRAGKIRYVGLSNFTGWQLQLSACGLDRTSERLPGAGQPPGAIQPRHPPDRVGDDTGGTTQRARHPCLVAPGERFPYRQILAKGTSIVRHSRRSASRPVPVHLVQLRNLRSDLGLGGRCTPGCRGDRHLARPGGAELGS